MIPKIILNKYKLKYENKVAIMVFMNYFFDLH